MYMGKSPSGTEASSIVLSSETVKRFFLKAAKHARAAKVSKAITHFLGFQLMTDPSLMDETHTFWDRIPLKSILDDDSTYRLVLSA